MDNKIKLVYNWIGPNGPIWNTELPNVLNFSHVAEGAGANTSYKVFGDDISQFFQTHVSDDYEVYPACSIRHGDPRLFILPFTLSWRIPFDRYFTGQEGILEFGHIPPHVLQQIRIGNGYILINHSMEAFMQPVHLEVLHSYFRSTRQCPLHKIIYVTGCVNAEEIYEEYCTARNIPDTPHARLSIVPFHTAFTSFVVNTKEAGAEPDYDTETIPPKLFLMWNRRLRDHRIELAVNLERHNLVDRSLISFSNEHQDFPGRSAIAQFNYDRLLHIFNIDREYTDRFIARLPLILDGEENVMQMCQDYGNVTRSYYQQSLVSIVTETNFYEREVSLTEKSFKPAKEKHPFITAGAKGVLKGMHRLGFRTFNEFWDESYDDIVDDGERMNKIMEIIGQIGTWTPDQILDFRRRVKPILEHNYNVIRNASTDITIKKITDIVRKS
jgi:hypothetical protein